MYDFIDYINFEDSDQDDSIDYSNPNTYSNGIDYSKTVDENRG